ncbi:STAS domain-containing protein [Nonomuraea fuscirosea]|uniref:STAS domain-containing protein n=1 Tax=Nonomuraea fuscirosea TaxID=1291556 RepID=UPI00371D5CEE
MRLSSTRYSAGDRVVTLTPVGEIDLLTAGALRAAIADALRAPRPLDVIVDLAGVTFLDCAGTGALVAGRNIAIRRGRGEAGRRRRHVSRFCPEAAERVRRTRRLAHAAGREGMRPRS